MIKNFSKSVIGKMNVHGNRYYVYGLFDPSTPDKPFYIGKGTKNRVFKHAKKAVKASKKGEDNVSLKISTIQKIMDQGKEVVCKIYRWGLSESEAFAVEATLIDCFQNLNLTNIQAGHDTYHGMTTVDELQDRLSLAEYKEPKEKYVIIKTKQKYIDDRGDLYEAIRRYWHADLEKAQKYQYVVAAVQGIVKGVFKVEKWFLTDAEGEEGRIEFIGSLITKESIEDKNNKEQKQDQSMLALIGKRLPAKYTKKGLASPFLYKTKGK